jgi:hypothetical protein
MTDLAAPEIARPRSRKAGPEAGRAVASVTATQLGEHLGVTRQRIGQLADVEHVLERRPDGRFDLDSSRLKFIRHLQAARRGSARSEADAQFTAAKTQRMKIRIAEKEKALMQTADAVAMIEEIVGIVRTELGQLPPRIGGRDLIERRRLEKMCNEMLDKICETANKRAAELEISERVENAANGFVGEDAA